MSKEYKITVIDYVSGNYFEIYRDFDNDADYDEIADSVLLNIGIETELLSEDEDEL